MTPEECIYRADRARAIFEDSLFVEAVATVRNAVRDQVFALPIEARDDREKLVLMDKMAQQFLNWFEFAMRGGDVARNELLMQANASAKLDAIREHARNYAG